MKGLFAIVVTAGALLLGSATAQYGYPYGYPFGYYDPSMPMGFGNPVLAEQIRQGDAQLAEMMRQSDAWGAELQQQMTQSQAYFDQLNAQINQYYIDLYRTTTGDQTSPNETALYYGQVIHCQQNPVDCETAARNAKINAAEAAERGRALMDAWTAGE